MLTLDKISTHSIFNSNKNQEIINLFQKYNIKTFADLKGQIENHNPEFNNPDITKLLDYAELVVKFQRKRRSF